MLFSFCLTSYFSKNIIAFIPINLWSFDAKFVICTICQHPSLATLICWYDKDAYLWNIDGSKKGLDQLSEAEKSIDCDSNQQAIEYNIYDWFHKIFQVQSSLEVDSKSDSKDQPEADCDSIVNEGLLFLFALHLHRKGQYQDQREKLGLEHFKDICLLIKYNQKQWDFRQWHRNREVSDDDYLLLSIDQADAGFLNNVRSSSVSLRPSSIFLISLSLR